MGLFSDFRDRFRRKPPVNIAEDRKRDNVVVGAKEEQEKQFQAFDNTRLSTNGDLSGFDTDSILRDKQGNIDRLYQLADYYVDADEIIHGIVKNIYVPYSCCSPWVLLNVEEKTRKIYEEEYRRINLKEKMESIFYQYWKYGNVVIYYNKGYIQTLPIHKCKIGNVALNGEPIIDFDCLSIQNEFRQKGYTVKENWIKDNNLETVFKGYPDEIVKALNNNMQYAQLNPKNVYVMQGMKEDWQKYSIPFIASCLPHLSKKALISQYEDALLNIGARPIVHVTYGDKNKGVEMLPDAMQLSSVQAIFKKSMNGFPLAVTNHLVEAKIIQPDTSDLFQWKKYEDCNNAILSAGGISGILVTGVSNDGSTFASAQVSMNTAAVRIEDARKEFCRVMTRINRRILADLLAQNKYNVKQFPTFSFMPMSMEGQKSLQDTCNALWRDGVISTKTMLDMNGFAIEHELELRKNEMDETDEILKNRDQQAAESSSGLTDNTGTGDKNGAGRPEMTNEERSSDPESAMRGKMPKPSNPEGSLPDDST